MKTIPDHKILGTSVISAETFPFGELLAEPRSDDVSVQFQYPFYNTEFDMRPAVIVGSATATVTGGYLRLLSTGVDSVTAQTKNGVRYRPGHSGYAQFTAMFSGSGTGYAGVGVSNEDGFFLKVTNGVMQCIVVRDGVETIVTSAGADGYFPSGSIKEDEIDYTKLNIFRIKFGYLGVASPVFEIKLGEWHTLCIIATEGTLTAPHVSNPVLPVSFRAVGAMEVRCASLNAGKLGDSDFVGARFFESDSTKTVPISALATVGTFRNKSTFKGETNRVKAMLLRYNLTVDAPASGAGTVQVKIRKGATLTGTPTWSDIDVDNSVMEIDAVQTYASGGRVIFTEHALYSSVTGGSGAKIGGSITQQAETFGLFLLPNETATITVQNVNAIASPAVTARVVFNWIELF